jgi:CheY-like chemotaxis protein
MKAGSIGSGETNFVWRLLRILSPARKPRTDSRRPTAAPAADPAVVPNGKKILIVDDDAVIVATSAMKLRSKGYAVVTAVDCSEALGVVRDERPDLILLDLMFPPNVAQGGAVAWDGFVIMSWLRQFQETRNTPIIVITNQDAAKFEARSLKAGARAFFQKPIDHAGLLAVIQQNLGEAPEGGRQDSVRDFQI